MNLTIQNAQPALAADHTAVGAAIKVLIAGGAQLDQAAIKRASGLTDYVWTRKGDEVLRLVNAMSAQEIEA